MIYTNVRKVVIFDKRYSERLEYSAPESAKSIEIDFLSNLARIELPCGRIKQFDSPRYDIDYLEP